jgi:hypothetical protein
VATTYKRPTDDGKVRYTAYIRIKDTQGNPRTFNRKVDVIRWAKQQETAALLFTMVAALQPVNSRSRVAHSSDLTYNLRLFKEELCKSRQKKSWCWQKRRSKTLRPLALRRLSVDGTNPTGYAFRTPVKNLV